MQAMQASKLPHKIPLPSLRVSSISFASFITGLRHGGRGAILIPQNTKLRLEVLLNPLPVGTPSLVLTSCRAHCRSSARNGVMEKQRHSQNTLACFVLLLYFLLDSIVLQLGR